MRSARFPFRKWCLCTAALVGLGVQQAFAQYTQSNLNLPSGTSAVPVSGIYQGQIVGGAARAYLWNGATNNVVNLDPGKIQSAATSIAGNTEAGYFTAFTTSSGGRGSHPHYWHHACVWKGVTNTFVDLHPLAINYESQALGTNGTYEVGWAGSSAYMWLGTAASAVNLNPAGFTSSVAKGIDGSHEVGYGYNKTDNAYHALLWTGTSNAAIDLNPTANASGSSFATCVDDTLNQQGGYLQSIVNSVVVDQAYLWNGTADGGVNLAPANSTSSVVTATRGGTQVGYAVFNGVTHAVVWHGSAASALDLTPGGSTSEAMGVDFNGDIVGVIGTTPVRWRLNSTLDVSIVQNPAGNAAGWNTAPVVLQITSPFTTNSRIYYKVDNLPTTYASGSTYNLAVSSSSTHYIGVYASNGTAKTLLHRCTVNIDSLPPVTTDKYVNFVLTLTATDKQTGVALLNYILDGQQGVTNRASISFPLTNVPHTVTFWSVDKLGNTETQHTVNIPALPPVLSTINPTQVLSGGGDMTLAITGAGFLSSSQVMFGATALATTYGSATGLTATIPAALQTPGVFPITVVNSSPGAGTSKAINFTVFQQADAAGQAQNIGENGGYFDISPVTSSSGFTLNGSSVHVVTTANTVFYNSSGGGITSTTFYDLLNDGTNVSVVGVYSNGTITAWSASLH